MIITCEKCSTQFSLDASLIQPQGSKVRCSQCKHVFTAFPESPDTGVEDFDTPMDFDTTEPDFPLSGDDSEDMSFDAADSGKDLEMEFSEEDSLDFDDQDFDDQDIDFDEIEFDEATDFETSDFEQSNFDDAPADDLGSDLLVDMPGEQDFLEPDGDLELDIPDAIETLEEEPAPALQDAALTLDKDDLDLADGDLDLELEPLNLEIDDIDPIEKTETLDEIGAAEESSSMELADIDINFDPEEEDNDLVLDDDFSLDSDAALSSQSDLEDIELETDDLDDGLDLVFDDDPDADLVFEEPGDDLEGLEDLDSSLEIDNGFEQAPASLEEQEFEPELELEDEPDFFIEEDSDIDDDGTDGETDGEKFAEYEAVLEEDPGTEEIIPDPELDEDPMDLPDMTASDLQEAQKTESEDEMLIGGPVIADGGKKPAKTRSGIGAPVKVLFLLFLLVIAAYVATLRLGAQIPFISDINIPYITDALKPASEPIPQLKPIPNELSINGRFVSNATAGELFIVTGRIDNPSKIHYSNIKVKGTLLDKTKTKVGTQTAYCGNIIPEEVLKKANISDITKQLGNKDGLQKANVNVKPSGSVLFMLVFSNLPENLTNFTVEVIHFESPVQKN